MEENQYEETRQKRYKKKRIRKRRTLFTLIFLLVIAIASYAIFQYQSGLKLAKQDDEQSDIEFTGDDELKTVTNYLIIGVDSRGEEQSRSDTMMLLSRN